MTSVSEEVTRRAGVTVAGARGRSARTLDISCANKGSASEVATLTRKFEPTHSQNMDPYQSRFRRRAVCYKHQNA